jgi:hypothetical protein
LLKSPASRDAIERIEQEEFVLHSDVHRAACHAASEVTDVSRKLWALQTESHDDWERKQNASTVASTATALAAGLYVVDSSYAAASAEAIEVALAYVSAKGEITGNAVRLAGGAAWKAAWTEASTATWNERWRASYLAALRAARRALRLVQAGFLKDLFGNPFRRVKVERSWLLWNEGVVLNIVRSFLEQRSFEMLPILADALGDAGCSDPDILNHCREPGEHVRGCWLIDALLGKT